MKTDVLCSSEMSVDLYRTKRRHVAHNNTLQIIHYHILFQCLWSPPPLSIVGVSVKGTVGNVWEPQKLPKFQTCSLSNFPECIAVSLAFPETPVLQDWFPFSKEYPSLGFRPSSRVISVFGTWPRAECKGFSKVSAKHAVSLFSVN
jgi:hypothetical protein